MSRELGDMWKVIRLDCMEALAHTDTLERELYVAQTRRGFLDLAVHLTKKLKTSSAAQPRRLKGYYLNLAIAVRNPAIHANCKMN